MKKRRLGFFLLVFFSARAFAQEDPLTRNYRISADLRRADRGIVEATADVTLRNNGKTPLQEIRFVLYPNRFRKALPGLNDINYRRIYPDGFSRGEMEVRSVSAGGRPLALEALELPGVPAETLARLTLPRPLPPGGATEISFSYAIRVPEKFGSFGRYRGILTMSGGWYPYIPSYSAGEGFREEDLPPRADWEVSLRTDTATAVNGVYFSGPEIRFTASGVREVGLVGGKTLRLSDVAGRAADVRIITSERDPDESLRPARELAVRWLEFIDRHPELVHARTVALVQAPLREMLSADGEGMSLLSDRAFKLVSSLRQYHSTPVVRALFYQLIFPLASRLESARDCGWVSEAVAWYWTGRFMRENTYHHLDARTLGPIKMLGFLPSIDRVVYTPQFAFFDVFYDYLYPHDPVRDDSLRFNHNMQFGRTVFGHLEDEVGAEMAGRIAEAYPAQDKLPFARLAETVSQKPVSGKFTQWSAPRPPVNYALGPHKERKTAGGYENTVTVRREARKSIEEPVELGVLTRGDERLAYLWNGPEEKHDFVFETVSPIRTIEIDPRHRLLETRLDDNRSPPLYKLVLTDLIVDYDFNAGQPSGYLFTQFRRAYGGNNRYNFTAAYGKDVYGVGVGYTRLFGRLVDRLRLSHAMSVGFDFDRFDDDLALPEPSGAAVAQVGPRGNSTVLSAAYSFGNQVSFTNPLEGGGGGISAAWSSKYFGGDFNYYRVSAGGSWILPFHPSYFVALRGVFGFSGPADIPSQAQFALGGINGIRGLALDDDHFKGRNIFLTSAEFRHLLLKDIDLNLWLFRIRDIQGALFADAGRATDTVQERANRVAFGASVSRTTLRDLFNVADFSTDAGYGIRLLVDYLGVNPGLIRLDAAKSLSETDNSIRYYFGVIQSF